MTGGSHYLRSYLFGLVGSAAIFLIQSCIGCGLEVGVAAAAAASLLTAAQLMTTRALLQAPLAAGQVQAEQRSTTFPDTLPHARAHVLTGAALRFGTARA